jgi:hypothetical protein
MPLEMLSRRKVAPTGSIGNKVDRVRGCRRFKHIAACVNETARRNERLKFIRDPRKEMVEGA